MASTFALEYCLFGITEGTRCPTERRGQKKLFDCPLHFCPLFSVSRCFRQPLENRPSPRNHPAEIVSRFDTRAICKDRGVKRHAVAGTQCPTERRGQKKSLFVCSLFSARFFLSARVSVSPLRTGRVRVIIRQKSSHALVRYFSVKTAAWKDSRRGRPAVSDRKKRAEKTLLVCSLLSARFFLSVRISISQLSRGLVRVIIGRESFHALAR